MAETINLIPYIEAKQSSGLKSGGGDGTSSGMDARVTKLEGEMIDVRVTLARIEEKLNTLATKDDVSRLAERLSNLEGTVKTLPTSLQLILFVIAVLGIAGLAKYFAP